jgi:hypothetical protein
MTDSVGAQEAVPRERDVTEMECEPSGVAAFRVMITLVVDCETIAAANEPTATLVMSLPAPKPCPVMVMRAAALKPTTGGVNAFTTPTAVANRGSAMRIEVLCIGTPYQDCK